MPSELSDGQVQRRMEGDGMTGKGDQSVTVNKRQFVHYVLNVGGKRHSIEACDRCSGMEDLVFRLDMELELVQGVKP